MNSSNKIVRLFSAIDLARHWPFIQESREGLVKKARARWSEEEYFNMLTRVTNMGVDGLVLLLTSKNDKPLGIGCAFVGVDFDGNECFYVWATYSNGKCHTCLSELLNACKEYARSIGQKVIKMASPRINGAAKQLFCDTLGFRREAIIYTLDV
jgi:hypothetical protein